MTAREIKDHSDVFMAPARPNMWKPGDCNLGTVRAEINLALVALAPYADDVLALPEEAVDALAAARRALNEIDRYLPSVYAWCVVKHYGDTNRRSDVWKPRPWCGFKTREQAIAFCDVIADHYLADAKRHGWTPDTWTVELRPCRVTEMVAPDVAPADYKRLVLR